MSSTIPTAADRQNEVAALVLSAERVANRMIERTPNHGGPPTLIVSADEWAMTTMHMCRLAGCARELHGILASGVTARMLVAPKADVGGAIDG